MMTRHLRIIAGLTLALIAACNTTRREQPLRLEGSELGYGLNVNETNKNFTTAPRSKQTTPRQQPTKVTRTFKPTPWLPGYLQGNGRVERVIHDHIVREPVVYERGVYGKVGSATYYVSTLRQIPDWDRLYWVMIKVLSEKYGCFATGKDQIGHTQTFQCRDGRRIVFWRYKGNDWIQFHARQYDEWGNELIVDDGRLIERR